MCNTPFESYFSTGMHRLYENSDFGLEKLCNPGKSLKLSDFLTLQYKCGRVTHCLTWIFVLRTNLAIKMRNHEHLDVSLDTFGRFYLENHVTPQNSRMLRASKPVMVTLR